MDVFILSALRFFPFPFSRPFAPCPLSLDRRLDNDLDVERRPLVPRRRLFGGITRLIPEPGIVTQGGGNHSPVWLALRPVAAITSRVDGA